MIFGTEAHSGMLQYFGTYRQYVTFQIFVLLVISRPSLRCPKYTYLENIGLRLL
jgi:hypothetical protein